MCNYLINKFIKSTSPLLGLLILLLMITSSLKAQPYFNKNVVCDTCTGGGYGYPIINNSNQLVVLGFYATTTDYKWVLDKYDVTLSNKTTFIHSDSLLFTEPVIFFQNPITNSYNIMTYYNVGDSVGWNGNSSIIHYKFDSNFHLFSRQVIDTFRFDKQDTYRRVHYFNNKLYCMGEFYDSTAGFWKETIGLKVLDTNGNQLLRKIYPLPNLLMNVADFTFDGTNFYAVGTYQVDYSACTNYFEAYAIKIDTLGNLKWLKKFPAKYDNNFQGVKIMPNGNVFITGGGDNGCGELGVINWRTEVTNVILDTSGNQLYKDTAITTNNRLQQGSYVFPRNDSSMMVFAYRNTWIAEWEDYIFQVTNNQGHIVTEAIHQAPDSSNLLYKSTNRFYGGLYYPPTKGYVMVGQTYRYKSNGIDSYTQPWIVSVDSNGCINMGCAVPLSNEDFIKENHSISIYPNPANNYLYLQSGTNVIAYKLYNSMGTVVKTNFLKNNSIDISDLPIGIYYLQLQTEKGILTKKFSKE